MNKKKNPSDRIKELEECVEVLTKRHDNLLKNILKDARMYRAWIKRLRVAWYMYHPEKKYRRRNISPPFSWNLKGPALLLWEIATAYNLEPEDLAPYVGVSVSLIYDWFRSKQIPTEDEKAKIIAAVRKIDKDWRQELPMVIRKG